MNQLTNYLHSQLTSDQYSKIERYLALVLKWNKTYNLTSIVEPEKMWTHHILDSLALLPYIQGTRIIDVGTGAGFPGIPLAIKAPHKQFILLDSNSKKTRFLTQVKIELQLDNVEIVHARAEDYQPLSCFDYVITRAFAKINAILLKTQHLCCPDGCFLAMKGKYPEDELQDLPATCELSWSKALEIFGLDAERHLICVRFVDSKRGSL